MSWRDVRPHAIGIVWRGEELLVERYDETEETFFRPLGGGVEFGESSRTAVAREFREETGFDVAVEELLGVVENVFEYDGTPGHEVVFVYEVSFVDDAPYERSRLVVTEDDAEADTVDDTESDPQADTGDDTEADTGGDIENDPDPEAGDANRTATWRSFDALVAGDEPLYPAGLRRVVTGEADHVLLE